MKIKKTPVFLMLLSALFVVFHWPVFFGGKAYLNGWIFRSHAPFQPLAPVNFLNQSSDLVTHYFGYKYFIARCLKAGLSPLWCPDVFCGIPLFANGSSAVFSPLNLLYFKFDPYTAYSFVLAVFFLCGGALFFFYLRRALKLSEIASFCGAATLVFCPFLAESIDYDTLLAFLWSLPLVLLLTEKAARPGGWAWAPALAAALFLTLCTSHVHGLVNAFGVFFIYLFVAKRPEARPRQLFFTLGLTVLLFLGLSLVLLLPTFEFFKNSQWVSSKAPGQSPVQLPLTWLTSVYPVTLKLPYADRILASLLPGRTGVGYAVPLGFLPFLSGLAGIFGLFSKTADRRVRFFAALVLLYHALTVAPPSLFLPGPVGRLFDATLSRFWQVYVIASAALCAYAVDALVSDMAFRVRMLTLTKIFALFIVGPVTLAAAVFTFSSEKIKPHLIRLFESKGWMGDGEAHYRQRFEDFFQITYGAVSLRSLFILLPVITGSGLIYLLSRAARVPDEKKQTLKTAFCVLLVAELLSYSAVLRPAPIEREKIYPPTRVTDFLKQDPGVFRTLSLQSPAAPGTGTQKYILKPNLGLMYGLTDVGGQDSVLNASYLYFAQKYLSDDPSLAASPKGILDFEAFNPHIASFLNVKYVLAAESRAVTADGFEPVFTAEGITVHKNKKALPRFFFTRKLLPMPENADTVYEEMMRRTPGGEPQVYLDAVPANAGAGEGPAPEPELVMLKPGDALVRVNAPSAGALVYTDNFDRGWRAWVDGAATPVRRVNGLFKAVTLSAGTHEIRWVYDPGMRFTGVLALITALGIVLFYTGRILFYSRR